MLVVKKIPPRPPKPAASRLQDKEWGPPRADAQVRRSIRAGGAIRPYCSNQGVPIKFSRLSVCSHIWQGQPRLRNCHEARLIHCDMKADYNETGRTLQCERPNR